MCQGKEGKTVYIRNHKLFTLYNKQPVTVDMLTHLSCLLLKVVVKKELTRLQIVENQLVVGQMLVELEKLVILRAIGKPKFRKLAELKFVQYLFKLELINYGVAGPGNINVK